MKPITYPDGQPVRLHDVVSMCGDVVGEVVAVPEAGEFAERYPADEWRFLGTGILVVSDAMGLVHYPDVSDIELVRRAASAPSPSGAHPDGPQGR